MKTLEIKMKEIRMRSWTQMNTLFGFMLMCVCAYMFWTCFSPEQIVCNIHDYHDNNQVTNFFLYDIEAKGITITIRKKTCQI